MDYNLILLRGLAREQGHWGPFMKDVEKIQGVAKVVSIDLPGNGDFYKLTSPATIGEMAEFVHSHNPFLQDDNPTALVAISLGGMVATELCRRYEKNYGLAFLINTSFSGLSLPHQRMRPRALESFYQILRTGSAREKEELILELVSNREERRSEVLEAWTQMAHSRPTSVFNAFRQLVAAGRYRLPDKKPGVPLFLLGSEKDRMVDLQCSVLLSEKWNLPLTVHPDAGHELALDDPQWVCENIEFILAEDESAASA